MRQFITTDDSGYWKISTRHTTYYIINMNDLMFVRVPGRGRSITPMDNQWMQFTDIKCQLGSSMTIIIDYLAKNYIQSTDVTRIELMSDDQIKNWLEGYMSGSKQL